MGGGWSRQWNLEELKPAELHELTGIDFPRVAGILRRYEGYGDTIEEALGDLIDECEKHDLPIPIRVNGIYVCSTVEIHYFLKTRIRLNPIFTQERNGHYVAYVYHK